MAKKHVFSKIYKCLVAVIELLHADGFMHHVTQVPLARDIVSLIISLPPPPGFNIARLAGYVTARSGCLRTKILANKTNNNTIRSNRISRGEAFQNLVFDQFTPPFEEWRGRDLSIFCKEKLHIFILALF